MIDKRLMYAQGQRVAKTMDGSRPGYRGSDYGASAAADGYGANTGNNSGPTGNPNNQKDDISVTKDYRGPAELGVTTRDVNPVDMGDADFTAVGPRSKYASNKFREGMLKSIKEIQTNPKYGGGGFFDSGLGKFVKGIGMFYAPQIFGPKFATGVKAYKTAKVVKDFFDKTGATTSLTNLFSGDKTPTSKSKKSINKTGTGEIKFGGDGGEGLASLENQAGSYDEYILLLQKLQSGNISDSEQNRFNVLKNMLGI